MTSDLPGTIELHQSIPHPLGGGAVIGGSSYLDDQAAWRSVWPSRMTSGSAASGATKATPSNSPVLPGGLRRFLSHLWADGRVLQPYRRLNSPPPMRLHLALLVIDEIVSGVSISCGR